MKIILSISLRRRWIWAVLIVAGATVCLWTMLPDRMAAEHLDIGEGGFSTCDNRYGAAIKVGNDVYWENTLLLAVGNWQVVGIGRNTGQDLGQITVIPEFQTYHISGVPDHLDQTCDVFINITGVEVGERIEIGGPCSVTLNQSTAFPISIFHRTGEREISNILITWSTFVYRITGPPGSGYDGDEEPLEDIQPIVKTFTMPGEYLFEAFWYLPVPPNGAQVVEIGRDSRRFEVVPAGVPSSFFGDGCVSSFNPVLAQNCNTEDIRTEIELSRMEGGTLGGTVRCDYKGGFKADIHSVDPQAIRSHAAQLSNVSGPALDAAANLLTSCVIAHEQEHVKQLEQQNPDACDGCCCSQTPVGLVFLNVTKAQCVANERLAHGREESCLNAKIANLNQLVPDPAIRKNVDKVLKKVKNWVRDKINRDKYENCKSLP